MNLRVSSNRSIRLAGVAVVSISAFLLVFGAFSSGCGNGSGESSFEGYKKQWSDIMNPFETRTETDEQKAGEIIKSNDIAALIRLYNQRILNIEEVMKKIIALRPPKDLWKAHSLTLSYLLDLRDQVTYQNNLNDALITGKPVKDLQSISGQAVLKTRIVGAELLIEIQRVGLQLQSGVQQPPQQSATQ